MNRVINFIKTRICIYINRLLYLYWKLENVDESLIVFESEGDLCDNAYALYDHMERILKDKQYHIVWLVENVERCRKIYAQNVDYIYKRYDTVNSSLMRILACTKFYIFDHNNLYSNMHLKKRCSQTIAYLSHGRGFKAIKGNNTSDFDVLFATGEIPAKGLGYFWKCDDTKIVQLGYPRIDYFFENNEDVQLRVDKMLGISKNKKTIIWMPTFRKANYKKISEDYIQSETGLPLVGSKRELRELNDFLKYYNMQIVLKVHHLQAELPVFSEKYSNIQIIKDEELFNNKIQLYQLVALTDALITDYSSIAIDYLPLNKPIVYTLDDYEEYKNSRGFYPENAIDYFKGYHTYSISDLKMALQDIYNNIDCYKEERNELVDSFFKYIDGNSSIRILEYLKIL